MENYIDEIEDFGDLGQCIYNLLAFDKFGVKDELWNILNEALSNGSMSELKELFAWWKVERETR